MLKATHLGWGFATALFILSAYAMAGAQTVELPGHVSAGLAALTRPASSDRQLKLTVMFALRNHAELDKLLADQQNPASPHYQQWLTGDEFRERFGPSEADYEAVKSWLTAQGFTIVSSDIGDASISVATPVSIAEKAFGVDMRQSDDGALYGNTNNPKVPARFSGVIGSIVGLDNLRAAVPM
jgi:subtilase family serine protease